MFKIEIADLEFSRSSQISRKLTKFTIDQNFYSLLKKKVKKNKK